MWERVRLLTRGIFNGKTPDVVIVMLLFKETQWVRESERSSVKYKWKKPTTTLETYFRSELRIFCILTAFHDTWTRRLGLLTLLTCRRCYCCCYYLAVFFFRQQRKKRLHEKLNRHFRDNWSETSSVLCCKNRKLKYNSCSHCRWSSQPRQHVEWRWVLPPTKTSCLHTHWRRTHSTLRTQIWFIAKLTLTSFCLRRSTFFINVFEVFTSPSEIKTHWHGTVQKKGNFFGSFNSFLESSSQRDKT